jgi:hypothetical protein
MWRHCSTLTKHGRHLSAMIAGMVYNVLRHLPEQRPLAFTTQSLVLEPALDQLRGEVRLAHERAQELIELADEYGLDLWLVFGTIDLGWAEVEMGQPSAA